MIGFLHSKKIYSKGIKLSIVITLTLSSIFSGFYAHTLLQAQTDPVAEREARLRAELDQVLKDIQAQQGILAEEQQKGSSIARDVAILTAKINEAKLKIRAHDLSIQRLGKDINQKTETINSLTGKIEDGKDSLAQLIRKTNEIDSFTMTDVILSNQNISDFFSDVDTLNTIKENIQVALGNIKTSKGQTEEARKNT